MDGWITLTFIAPAHADGEEETVPPRDSVLSLTGEHQATERSLMLGNPQFDLVLVAPRRDAVDTAKQLASESTGSMMVVHHLEIISSLALPSWQRLDTMLNRHDEETFTILSKADSDNGKLLKAFSEQALLWTKGAIITVQKVTKKFPHNVLIISRGHLLTAIALLWFPKEAAPLTHARIGPCEGFSLVCQVKGSEYITAILQPFYH